MASKRSRRGSRIRRTKKHYYRAAPSKCFYVKDQASCSADPYCSWGAKGCRLKKYTGSYCPTKLDSASCVADAKCKWSNIQGCRARNWAFDEKDFFAGGRRRRKSKSRSVSRRRRSRKGRRSTRRVSRKSLSRRRRSRH